jgi:hypothetical protein
MFTGNRGILHNDHQQLIKNYTLKAWITCTLTYKNVKREVMRGRKWTELFSSMKLQLSPPATDPALFVETLCINNSKKYGSLKITLFL